MAARLYKGPQPITPCGKSFTHAFHAPAIHVSACLIFLLERHAEKPISRVHTPHLAALSCFAQLLNRQSVLPLSAVHIPVAKLPTPLSVKLMTCTITRQAMFIVCHAFLYRETQGLSSLVLVIELWQEGIA